MSSELIIKQCSVLDIEAAPNLDELIDEYEAESSIVGMPDVTHKLTQYKQIEAIDAIFALAAYYQAKLIGFCGVLMPTLPHYGVTVAVAESLFVAKAYRHTGAGIKLIRAAERISDEGGSPGLLISAPVGSAMVEFLPDMGYVKTNEVFFRKRPDA